MHTSGGIAVRLDEQKVVRVRFGVPWKLNGPSLMPGLVSHDTPLPIHHGSAYDKRGDPEDMSISHKPW